MKFEAILDALILFCAGGLLFGSFLTRLDTLINRGETLNAVSAAGTVAIGVFIAVEKYIKRGKAKTP